MGQEKDPLSGAKLFEVLSSGNIQSLTKLTLGFIANTFIIKQTFNPQATYPA